MIAAPPLGRYARLVALPHTVFALPFAVGAAALGVRHTGARFELARLAWIVVAAASARTAALAFNRFADRRFDALNPRTQDREIPRGAVSPRAALIVTVAASALFLAAAARLGRWPLALAPVALALVCGYSLAKRFTWATHAWLGMALGGAPAGAWLAATGSFGLAPFVLSLAVCAWAAGFDLIYACQDVAFDRAAGLRSFPARFGVARALHLSAGLHALAVAGWIVFGVLLRLGAAYAAGTAAMAALLVWEHRQVTPSDLRRVDRAFFTLNGWVSVAFGACAVWEALR